MGPRVRPHLFALLYGDYPKLHDRLLDSFMACGAKDLPAFLWLNTVCDRTKRRLSSLPPKWRTFDSFENVGKDVAMRRMFAAARGNPDWNWLVWFDDDSYVTDRTWPALPVGHIESCLDGDRETDRRICYLGRSYVYPYRPGMWKATAEAKWFKGIPPQQTRGRYTINFATGGYWWLKRETMDLIDWPDPRLNHCGDDTLLAEAVRQQGLPFHKRGWQGVAISKARRRGRSEPRLGDEHAGLTWKDLGL